jgi:hypothetical protein
MTATTMAANTSNLLVDSFPATEALKQEQRKTMVAREGQRRSFDSKLSLALFNLNFEQDDNEESFPTIEWDSEDYDSDSVRSIDNWNTLLTDFDSPSSLCKRGRSDSGRLVRSKKIKSDLSSMAMGSRSA